VAVFEWASLLSAKLSYFSQDGFPQSSPSEIPNKEISSELQNMRIPK